MARQGVYSKKKTPVDRVRWAVKRRWRWFKRLSRPKKVLLVGTPILAFLIVTPIFTYLYYYNDIANQDRLMNANNTGVALLDKKGKIFYSTGHAEHTRVVPLSRISDVTENALIATEDKDFYEHSGFSFFSILRSIYSNIAAGDATAYGGSTLTQQLAKNTLLTTDQTVLRKYQELTIAMAIEQRYSKDEILAMYLNSVYFGNNSFGIEEAAQNYYGKKASDLTLAEASMLIGVLPAPSAYSPVDGSKEYAKERQTTVLSRMVSNGYITEEQKEAALAVKLKYRPAKLIDNTAPHFTEMVLAELYEKYGEEKVKRSGYRVQTTLDLKLQKTAIKAVNDNLAHIQANGGSNASVVVVDPTSGEIRALVGSIDYDNNKFGKVNMATTPRQPGSSFKPIYYAEALARGIITPTTVIKDEPTDFGGGYMPQNACRCNYGNVTVRQALNWSLNIPSVKVMEDLTIPASIEAAKNLGITTLDDSRDYGLALALGTAEVPLTEMTNAYAAFGNGGSQRPTSQVYSIRDKFNKIIYVANNDAKQAVSPQGAYLISDILSDNAARSRIFGNSLTVYGTDWQTKNVAVKTGTTEDARDAWTIGYTPKVATGVWVGNNDNSPMFSGGSDMAGPIWRAIMTEAIGSTSPAFTRPSGIEEATVCTSIGTFTDEFLGTNIPETCTPPPVEPKPQKPEEKKDKDKPKKDDATDEPPVDETPPADDGTSEEPTDGGGQQPPLPMPPAVNNPLE